MTRRLLLGAVAVALACAAVPASALGCPSGWKDEPTGLYSPLNGHPIYACFPYPGPR
jgi:hypothetical protein